MSVYFLRHAKTRWNLEGRLQGESDSPLLADSIAQIQKIADVLVNINFEICYLSPLPRVLKTYDYFKSLNVARLEIKHELKEMSCGSYTGHCSSEIPESFRRVREADRWNVPWPNGESYQMVFDRTREFAQELSRNENDCLIVAHETVNRVLIGHLLDLGCLEIMNMRHPNDVVYRIKGGRLDWIQSNPVWNNSTFIYKPRRQHTEFQHHLTKLFILDVDGVLTDGGVYYGEDGNEIKKFNARDGIAIKRLLKHGVEVGIISNSLNKTMIQNRAKTLGIRYVYVGLRPKVEIIDEWCARMEINKDNVVYIGDDVNDIEIIQRVGFSCCPSDASPIVREKVNCVLQTCGGNGVVRELVNMFYMSDAAWINKAKSDSNNKN